MEYLKKRITNYGFWVSLLSLIPLIMQAAGDTTLIPSNYQTVANIILSFLVAVGIVNDPTTDAKGYKDDK